MFNWKGFENREFCVDFKRGTTGEIITKDQDHFLEECEKQGYEFDKKVYKNTFRIAAFGKGGLSWGTNELPVIIYNPHTIDCSIAEYYIPERERLCDTYIRVSCDKCPIGKYAPKGCRDWEKEHPKEAVETLQAWSDEHPIEPVVTYLDKLLEVFPNTVLREKGVPKGICPDDIGLKISSNCQEGDNEICVKCWSQPYKENHHG